MLTSVQSYSRAKLCLLSAVEYASCRRIIERLHAIPVRPVRPDMEDWLDHCLCAGRRSVQGLLACQQRFLSNTVEGCARGVWQRKLCKRPSRGVTAEVPVAHYRERGGNSMSLFDLPWGLDKVDYTLVMSGLWCFGRLIMLFHMLGNPLVELCTCGRACS